MMLRLKAINSLRPNAGFVTVDGVITWTDTKQTQPSDAEIEAEMARLTALEPARIATENRRNAYIAEADPLFFKAQRGEATMEEWQAKVAEIKSRFPKG
jgi:hypothetical protein